ncbi:MAG: tRNA pseudouridine(54/55) synthase Pus10, partial [Methanosarcinales archaeon]|nr:tRNA pseudouridine(54/55) synthase Pus10 [Methanosarcinales archaeon]
MFGTDSNAEQELENEEIREIAQKIAREGPICDHCLGRQFAKVSSGLSNERR